MGWSPMITSSVLGFPESCCKLKAPVGKCVNIIDFKVCDSGHFILSPRVI